MRKRLTARNVRAESQADGLFPGDIGNEERAKNYHDLDEYTNYEEQPGWDIPDPTAPKINDERDEVGFGIPKTADAFQTAKAAAILAQMYLGDAAPDEAIEDQARDFMKLGHRRIVSSIKRWKATEPAPDLAPEEEKEEVQACKTSSEEVTPEVKPEETAPAVQASAEEVVEESEEGIVDDLTASEEEEAPEMELEIAPVGDESDNGPMFSGSEELNQAEADPELVALFAGEEGVPEKLVAKKASKQGIKHLAGQPKLASSDAMGVKELEGIWSGLRIPGL